MRTIACSAPYGGGGLGQALAQIVEDSRSSGTLHRYFAPRIQAGDESLASVVPDPVSPWMIKYTPLRYSPGWTNFACSDGFDRAVASRLPAENGAYVGFGGQSLNSFKTARRLGYDVLELNACNSHVRNVRRQHNSALKNWSFEQSWLNEAQVEKTIKEYEMADAIVVQSQYTWQTMIDAGVPDHKLRLLYLKVHPRFEPPGKKFDDGVFRIVYIGSVTVMKGIPVLLEAFSQLKDKNAELTIIGGWATRGMRLFLQKKMAEDSRIKIVSGDPLPYLHKANVCVHPTFEDGFAYAPVEAMACGVPVIVTEDTGMKELVSEGVNGYIVPTGSWEAILERLEFVRSASH